MYQQDLIQLVEQITYQERDDILRHASPKLRQLLSKIPVTIEGGDRTKYGDFSGTMYPHETPFAPFSYPSNIIIYASAFIDLAGDEKKLRAKIRMVLRHEYGHYLGLSEKELKKKGIF